MAQGDRRIDTICLVTLTCIAVGAALLWLRSILIPLTLAVLIKVMARPLLEHLENRMRFPRWLAMVSILFLGAVLFGLVVYVVSGAVEQYQTDKEVYHTAIDDLKSDLADRGGVSADLAKGFEEFDFTRLLGDVITALADVISQTALILLIVAFLLIGTRPSDAPRHPVAVSVEDRVRQYLGIKTVTSALTGTLTGGILYLLDVPLAVVFGLLAFLLNYIPNIGSVIAVLLPVPVVVLHPEIDWTQRILAIALPTVMQLGVGSILEPRIMGRSLELHPVTILVALMFWGLLWGPIGFLLAVPLTAMLKILFDQVELLRPVGLLLSGRLE